LYMQLAQSGVPTDGMAAHEASKAIQDANLSQDIKQDALSGGTIDTGIDFDKVDQPISNAMKQELADIMGVDAIGEEEITKAMKMLGVTTGMESVQEDAGEGHMSKSQLYQTAKMAIELIEMIKQGDDLEAWVQTKLNVAADHLQAVYHYEEYQKLNPYREQIDSNTFAKHSEIVKKSIDEILARETKIDDVDTKPGMMRILGKRVNEVEKNIAKETKEESVKETADKDRAIRFDKAMRSGQYEQFADILSDAMHFASVTNKDFERELQIAKDEFEDQTNEDAAGVGIITKQNTTADVKPGDEYKNVKKLGLKSSAYESKLTDMLKQRLK